MSSTHYYPSTPNEMLYGQLISTFNLSTFWKYVVDSTNTNGFDRNSTTPFDPFAPTSSYTP